MTIRRPVLAVAALLLLAGACGGGSDSADSGSASGTSSTTTAAVSSTTTTDDAGEGTSTTQSPSPDEVAIWPAATEAFATPEEAAADFVTEVLGVPPILGEFQAGDSRSGEMEIFFAGEAGDRRIFRGLLLLRKLGPDEGWFIRGVLNDNALITAPAAMEEVEAGPVTVEGVARGFEGSLTVSAFAAGDAATLLDQELAQGGSMETPEPFEVTLDLSDAAPGDVITLLVRGATGIETDPGEIGAIALRIKG